MNQPKITTKTYRELWEADRERKMKIEDDVDCRYYRSCDEEPVNDDDDADCFCD